MEQTRIIRLLQQHISGENRAAEKEELMQWLKGVELEEFNEVIKTAMPYEDVRYEMSSEFKQRLEQRTDELEEQEQETAEQIIPLVHRIHFLKTAWIRYAAAIIVVMGIGTYIYVSNQRQKPSVTQTNPVPVQNDVAPGGNKATLTLANGKTIVLDNAQEGEIAKEDNATVTKTADGKIVYDPHEKSGNKILYNTMATPRGGQYQLTLPDGSQVWLNAESSITYPTAFNEKERRITITGEAYFEVAKDKSKPFQVDIGTATIEVLGTQFNLNTYKEEPTKNTTLLEGSVRIKTVHTSLKLEPGQQGQLSANNLSLAVNPDVEQVMAWKNGVFNFNGTSIEAAMRQLARWYDIKIEYDDGIPPGEFGGEMGRSLTLQQVLKGLEGVSARFRLEGKTLHIMPLLGK